ncbi:signal peptidase II [Piscirickettsia litoralis]|uniref:Lipoprotein signal peptidase n=1 Tax=Piscirickettsia litoralis TaxID=1891921 RepID=A0ABX3A1I1_9GAMM|nr:signal peptidase II [Piscirickettsia litoralis]ODN42721.1 signal peptidase II [Piscirickettsia litoralis]
MPSSNPGKTQGQLRYLWLSLIALLLDLGSKWWAQSSLHYAEPNHVLSFLNWTLLYNQGAAFSFLSGQGGWQRWLFTAIALIVCVVVVRLLAKMPRHQHLFAAGLSLILAGALGNVIDRLRFGYVIDFIDVHVAGYHWPAFNIADSAICVGAVLLIWQQLRKSEKK